ncbi:MAG: CBS domain-containing protein [Bacteriovoracaceae bacterium]|nr:CBS domain-containing protein [Bacteriovoracaceae bacterium]
MTKAIPQIQKFMTTCPLTVNSDQTLKFAKSMMKEHSIRHLPVLDDGALVGMITERDIDYITSLSGVNVETEKVSQAMTQELCKVNPETALGEVCKLMASEKIGSVLVEDNKKLVGIFTWIDALKAMDELMVSRLK